jgi:hypothetical protein
VPSRCGILRGGAPLAGEDLLFPLPKGLEIVIRDVIHQVIDLVAGRDGGADVLVEGRGDRDANPLVAGAGMEIESRMLLAGPAPAVGLAAGAVLEDQGAAEQGFVSEELDGARACVALLG